MRPKPTSQDLKFAVLAADTVLLTFKEGSLYVYLITVDLPPHFHLLKGLPGGLVRPDETAEQAAKRHVQDKAQIHSSNVYVEQLYTFSDIDRDPRGRVVSVAYLALVPWEDLSPSEQKTGDAAGWYPVSKLPKLAYDHTKILHTALERLRSKIAYSTLISKMIPSEFTLTELEHAYAAVLETKIDKRNFRKKMLTMKLVKKLNKKRSGLKQRPADLFKFVSKNVQILYELR